MGFVCRRTGIFSSADASGLSAFVGRLSLPALLFLSMATLDFGLVDCKLVATIIVTKLLVFLVVVVATGVTSITMDPQRKYLRSLLVRLLSLS